MPGKIPDLINQYIETNKVKIENSSFAVVHQMIVSVLQGECASEKAKNNFKKKMHFSMKLCNNFVETYHFGKYQILVANLERKYQKFLVPPKQTSIFLRKNIIVLSFPKRRGQYLGKEQSLLKG